jgi:hypothetical protein
MSRDRQLLGRLTSGPVLQALGWAIIVLVSVLSLSLVATAVFHR